jgi:hypothetical protein
LIYFIWLFFALYFSSSFSRFIGRAYQLYVLLLYAHLALELMQKNLWQKQIPTLLGIGVLVVALVVGVFMFGQGTGVFAPRAAPETTPQKIQVTNVNDTSFTVSFFTQEQTAGFVKYGTEPGALRLQASDDRDQLSGAVGNYTLHHVTVRGLTPNTAYYYVLGTGSRATFDNNGTPFSITTAARGGTPTAAQTAYGNVLNQQGSPAEGAIAYLTIDGVGPMSSLVKSSGSWAIPLSNARKTDGTGYAELTDSTAIGITVQGTQADSVTTATATVGTSQPVANITLGAGASTATTTTPATTATTETTEVTTTETTTTATTETTDTIETTAVDSPAAAAPGALGGLVSDQTTATDSATTTTTIVDIDSTETETVIGQPKIVGKAAPNVTVTLEVNSEHQIIQDVQTDADGNFELDLETLGANLEPGEHTVTATYIDPETGQTVTKTQTFTIGEDNVLLAQAETTGTTTTTSQPFSSGSPFPASTGGTSTQSATATESATATDSADKGGVSTDSGRTSQPATSSALPQSGSVGMTMALVIGGLFFIISGLWSFWIAQQLDQARVEG